MSSADPLDFRATMDVQDVVATGAEWQVFGRVFDATPRQFTAQDVATGNLFYCETSAQDVDKYRVAAIGTASVDYVTLTVAYIGTNGAPAQGQPAYGHGHLCADVSGTNGVGVPPSDDPGSISPLLKRGVEADIAKTLAALGGAVGPAGPAGPAGPPGTNGVDGAQGPPGPADWNAITNVPAGITNAPEIDPAWAAVSNDVSSGAAAGATASQPGHTQPLSTITNAGALAALANIPVSLVTNIISSGGSLRIGDRLICYGATLGASSGNMATTTFAVAFSTVPTVVLGNIENFATNSSLPAYGSLRVAYLGFVTNTYFTSQLYTPSDGTNYYQAVYRSAVGTRYVAVGIP